MKMRNKVITVVCLVAGILSQASGYAAKGFAKPQILRPVPPALEETVKGEQLLVQCNINGHSIPGIIDTGAQVSIMSESCLKKCQMRHEMDSRYTGRAVGIGQSEIVGRVLNLPIQMGPVSFKNGVSVLKNSRVDFIVGMDILSKFESEINVKQGWLKLRADNREYKIPFTKTPIATNIKLKKEAGEIHTMGNHVYQIFGNRQQERAMTLTADVVSKSLDSSHDDTSSYSDDEDISLEGI